MSLEANKIFAAVLTAGVTFMSAGVIGGLVVHPHKLERSAISIGATPQTAAAPGAASIMRRKPMISAACP